MSTIYVNNILPTTGDTTTVSGSFKVTGSAQITGSLHVSGKLMVERLLHFQVQLMSGSKTIFGLIVTLLPYHLDCMTTSHFIMMAPQVVKFMAPRFMLVLVEI